MKRNWTLEIAFQSWYQKKIVRIRKGSKNSPKTSEKTHAASGKSIYQPGKSIYQHKNFKIWRNLQWEIDLPAQIFKNWHNFQWEIDFPKAVNRFPTVKKQKISILKRKFLIKPFYKHLMILDSIVHENSIKSWANSTNWITRSSLKDHITKINKKLHHERCRSHLPKDGSRTLSTIFKTCFKSTPRINLQSFDLPKLMKRKCLDGGLAQRLASSNEELTNFYERELWVNLVKRELREFLARWIWL